MKRIGLTVKEIAYEEEFNSKFNIVNTFRQSASLTALEFGNTPV